MRVQRGQMLIRWDRVVAQMGSVRLKTKGIRVDLMVFADFIYDAKIGNFFYSLTPKVLKTFQV